MGASRLTRAFISLAMVAFAITVCSSRAGAQQDAEKQVQRMNKRAMADYDSLEFEMSRKTLMDAVALLRQTGIDETPVAAKTYLNLGIVYVAGFKDRNRGLQQFVQALKINPSLKLDPSMASPELEEVWNAAKKQVGGRSETAAPKDPDDNNHGSDDVRGLAHTPVDEARPGEPITIKAQLGSDTGASRIFVLYRPGGQSDYTALALKNAGGADWIAVIPGDAIEDRPLQYYLEARDRKGRVLIGSGSASNPYIVTLAETAPGARIVHRREVSEDGAKYHRLFVNVMPGFGIGYHPAGNVTEVAWQQKTTNAGLSYQRAAVSSPGGVAIAPFHLAIELGGNITRHFALSLIGRFEVVTGANAQTESTENGSAPVGATTKAGGAVAGFLRARYRFLDGKLHPYVHVDIGAGEIRHALNLSGAQNKGAPLVDEATANSVNANNGSATGINLQYVCTIGQSCYDSLKMGYLFLGGGAGVSYDVWKYIAIMLDVDVLGGIGVGPGGQSGMDIDIQLGVGAHFL